MPHFSIISYLLQTITRLFLFICLLLHFVLGGSLQLEVSVKVRGQLSQVGSFLLPGRFQRSNLGGWA